MKISSKIFLIVCLFLALYSYFIEPNKLETTKYKLEDSELSGIKIVFVSDFHIKPNQQKRLEKIVKTINLQEADMVLSTGDFVSGHLHKTTMPPADIAKELGKVKSKYGFYTTLGNHDYWFGEKDIKKALEKQNIKVLNNKNVKLKIQNKEIYIVGIEDLTSGAPSFENALDGAKSPTIFLTHTPDVFSDVPKWINLTLAGHTHGGQIRLPFFGALVVPSEYGDKYSVGLINEDEKKIIVTKGIGTSILPIRFNCQPEIVVIEFF